MGQRLVRAKTRIREAGIPFRVPDRADLGERLDAVLEAIYAAFAEGWADPAGTETRRRNLAGEGIWLGRLVASLMPDEPEALGPAGADAVCRGAARRAAQRRRATMCRSPSRTRRSGTTALIDEAEALLCTRQPAGRHRPLPARGGRAVGACRAAAVPAAPTGRRSRPLRRAVGDRRFAGGGDQSRRGDCRDAKARRPGSPSSTGIAGDRRLADYQPYWAARAGCWRGSAQWPAAAEAYDRAIGLERDPGRAPLPAGAAGYAWLGSAY